MAAGIDPDVDRMLTTARRAALAAGQKPTSPGYVLLAMLRDARSPAGQVLRRSGLREEAVRRELNRSPGSAAGGTGLETALRQAAGRAERLGRRSVGWEDLLLAITDDRNEATHILTAAGVRVAEVRDRTLTSLNIPRPAPPEMTDPGEGAGDGDGLATPPERDGDDQASVPPPADQRAEPATEKADAEKADAEKSRRVFVIHGRDAEALSAVRGFVRDLDLHAVEFGEVERLSDSSAPLVPETVTGIFSYVQAVVALLTPDEIVTLHPDLRRATDPAHERELTLQSRPNVLFELGMALGVKPNRTIIVQIGDVRPFSDIVGRSVLRLDDGSPGTLIDFKERLRKAGCPVRDDGRDWINTDRFTRLAAPRRRPEV